MTKRPILFPMVLLVGVGACGDARPARSPAKTPAISAPHQAAKIAASPGLVSVGPFERTSPAELEPTVASSEEPLDPNGVLNVEERRLLAADDAALTRDERFARARAQRKLVMSDRDHPLRPTLERIDREVASGEYADMAREFWMDRAASPGKG